MKTKTLSILFALVMILSLSAGVFADAFDETWDEETVLTVFNDLEVVFPDLFADDDSDFLFVEEDMSWNFPKENGEFVSKDITLDDVVAKAPIDGTNISMEASFAPCGDGLIKFDVTIHKAKDASGTASGYFGPSKTTYIRDIAATVDGLPADIKKCTSSGGDNCRSVKFNSKGEAHIKGYLYAPTVLDASAAPSVVLTIYHSTYMTALWPVETEAPIVASATAKVDTKSNYCQTSLEEYGLGGLASVRAKYDENTGEARLQATVRNYKSPDKTNYVIPAEVWVNGNRYTDYVCKYTMYNVPNAAPRQDYCKFGEGIAMVPNSAIRFDITIDHLSGVNEGDLPFYFRVGGMTSLIYGVMEPVSIPCPPVTRMSVMNPLKPFMTFYGMESDSAIKASGPYGVYEGGVWGLYQKCGKYAYLAVRLKNSGVQDEIINLNNVAVAINGGTPMSFHWVMSSVEEDSKGKILLEPGMDVILFGRAKVTDATYQLNADTAMTAAVNFLDYGLYITGSVYSDHNNTNCVAP